MELSILKLLPISGRINMNKELKLEALKSRYNLIMSRRKTMESEGVLRKIRRKIRKLEKELNA